MTRRLLLSLCLAATVYAQPKDGGAAAPVPAAKPEPVKGAALTVKEGFSTPESVLYDAATDTYLVSNINGQPLDKDNNGYISEISPDGTVVNARLVEGGKKSVTLNAPKGMAIVGDLLCVADIDTLRLFDRKTGAAKGDIALRGATFANDVASAGDGKLVYVTDSGLNPKFESTGTDAVYLADIKHKQAKVLIKSKDLHGPNGLLVTKDSIHVVVFGAAELQTYDLKGKKKGEFTALPNGGLDGIIAVGDEVYVSSWGAKAIYKGKPGGAFTVAFPDLEAPADIGFDTKRNRVLVPRFMGNAVEAWDIK